MSETSQANAPTLGERALDALRSYWSEAPGWRSLWREVFQEWSAASFNGHSEKSLGAEPRLMLDLMADAFADADAGVSNPLLKTNERTGGGSPRSNSAQNARRRALATVAAFYLASKEQRVPRVTNAERFQLAAEAVRKKGGSATPVEIKAAWQNRHRLAVADRAAIEEVRRLSLAKCAVMGDELYVEAAAFYTSSPVTSEHRGGSRR